jgi:hypothetical protein
LVGKIPASITKYITENQVPYYNINVVSSSPVVSATLGGSQGSLPVGELPNLTITQKGKCIYHKMALQQLHYVEEVLLLYFVNVGW